jgi:hypothetical protein
MIVTTQVVLTIIIRAMSQAHIIIQATIQAHITIQATSQARITIQAMSQAHITIQATIQAHITIQVILPVHKAIIHLITNRDIVAAISQAHFKAITLVHMYTIIMSTLRSKFTQKSTDITKIEILFMKDINILTLLR